MTSKTDRRGAFFAGAAIAVLSFASTAHAAPAAAAAEAAADDARDQRIARLEAAVAALEQQVGHEQELQQENTELKGEVGAVEAQVTDLKTTTNTQLQDVRKTAAAQPTISLANGRPTFSTADGAFTATLHGVLQLDTAAYFQNPIGPTSTDLRRDGPALGTSGIDAAHARNLKDGDVWRRARIGIDGTAFSDFQYRLLFDFAGAGTEDAGQLYEGWVQYSGFHPLTIRVGAYPPSIGLEDQGSTNGMLFLERPGPSDTARNLAAGDTRTAAEVFGYGDRWLASAAFTGRTIGVVNTGTVLSINSVPTTSAIGTAQAYDDQMGLVGRFTFIPFRGSDWLTHVGVHGSYVVTPPNASGPATNGLTPVSSYTVSFSDTPELRVDGTKFINTGSIDAKHADTIGVEFAAQKQNFSLEGEYESFGVQRSDGIADPNFSGWYVEGAWTLTGEARKYNNATAAFDAPNVAHPFNFKGGGGLGAWELALRYSDMNLNFNAGAPGTAPAADAIRGGDQQIWTAGLNWYLNPVVRVMFDVQRVRIDRLSPSATNYSTPAGAQIGQTYNAVAVRTQAAF